MWAKFTEITFSVLKDLPQSLTKLKDKVYTFFEKNPDTDNCGVAFSGIVKTQIKSSVVPHNLLECDFSTDLVLTICTSQNKGYSKVFSIEAIREMEREAY